MSGLIIPKATSIYMPNLLINGDFQVWQRGEALQVNGTGGAIKYYIDLWATYTGDWEGTLNKVENGVKITTSSNNAYLLQNIDHLDLEIGKQYIVVASINDTIHKITFKYGIDTPITEHLSILKTNYDTFVNVRGLKNKDIVNWVQLNKGSIECQHIKEDYSIALLRCQRYIQVLKGKAIGIGIWNSQNFYANVPLVSEFCKTPKISANSCYATRDFIGDTNILYFGGATKIEKTNLFLECIMSENISTNTFARLCSDDGIILSCEPL